MTTRIPLRRRLLPSLPLSVMVFLFWLLLSDSVGPQQWGLGMLLGVVVPIFAARLDREFAQIGSLRSVPRMLLVAAGDIVRSNIKVAAQVLGPESRIHPGFIWVRLDIANIHGIAALTSMITLTPGTVSAALSDDRKYLLVHVLHLDDPEALIAQIKSRYEKPLMEIFP
ncbi:Na+/H+ antiporter subunit E [Xanthomonas oryzae pv. oryzicola]|uniref:Na+/H+ antiporter subunit E n=1 Tax=Xanthomonas oryzae TaxID=347 RepID=UPI00040BE91E|nr:Na+/H+ antiporter subunit E [Xanthomonas oryzae]AJQ89381.1 cation:proton antiporter [Xanthomonas oryzae pv. oryzicola]AKO03197.1 cation:proton antiporter [Xanthomonas oryzae pv. oryzicola]AKO07111.1 cation:proton antiporter [Xanthomonas oryzae pv. oryzicola]OWB23547.1 Na+/H+ antiporter subunit E [Xanthomonas oryzae pv. oryzicola]OWB28740.1 Na+/H+ antiporter subunit E [Xanthomonas oryzae pv. oryzicola]